ncbi:MAG: LytTR family transcriptional regulator DNA-binding domain-containing protein [Defluviitaleaceae bacterium]|nr:LytTR family transcriptional regulator DNA-binding domain-containing protein [Defluviitaleaceae bacterium]
MKIIFEQPKDGDEDKIIVSCRHVTPEIMQLLDRITNQGSLIGYIDNKIYKVNPSDIYYIETVDRMTFLYAEGYVYESKQKLYELEEYLRPWNFLRIGKSCIANLEKIKSVSPMLNRRFDVVLANGERVIVSRQYVNNLKEYLDI